LRVLAVTPPECYLDPGWQPAGVTLHALEAASPDAVDETSLRDADLLLVAGYGPGASLVRALAALCSRFPAERIALVVPDAPEQTLAGARRLGIDEVWSGLSARRLAAMTQSLSPRPPQSVESHDRRDSTPRPPDRVPTTVMAETEAFERADVRREPRRGLDDVRRMRGSESGRAGTTLGVMSAKGGDGGSFVAANLATALAMTGEGSVVLIDLALPFGDVEMFLELQKPQYDLADFCEDTGRLDRELFDMMCVRMSSGLHHVPSLRALDRFGAILPERIEALIRGAASVYRFVVLDLGSGISPVGLDLMRMVDQLAVVATPTVPSLRKTSQILGIWERIGREPVRLLAVGNRMARKWDLSAEEFEDALRQKLARQLPNVPEALNDAVMAGLPLVQHAPRSPMTQQLMAWAAELAGVTPKIPKESLWQRLTSR